MNERMRFTCATWITDGRTEHDGAMISLKQAFLKVCKQTLRLRNAFLSVIFNLEIKCKQA
jgi:hypothetical protein